MQIVNSTILESPHLLEVAPTTLAAFSSTLIMILNLTLGFQLDSVKINELATYLGRRLCSFRPRYPHVQAHSPD